MEKSRQNIAMEQRLTQRLTQQQLRFVKMLEMTAPELDEEVEREMEANPALEAVDAETYRDSEPSAIRSPLSALHSSLSCSCFA